MAVMGVAKFERFFRVAAGLDVDHEDLKRYSDLVNQKIYDLLIRGQASAKANGRDIIVPHDLPIAKGLRERINEFRNIDAEIGIQPINVADRHGATPAQVALAWVLRQNSVIAIPKAGTLEHVRENRAALDIRLTELDLADLNREFPPPTGPQELEML